MDTQRDVFDENDNDDEYIQSQLLRKASEAEEKMYPAKSREKYFQAYNSFNAWRLKNGTNSLAEPVLLAYFEDLSATRAPNSLWPVYSMLKSVIDKKHNINIYNYGKLTSYLKQGVKGYTPKKSKTLTAENMRQFILEVPDSEWLDVKTAAIFGLAGACRKIELCNVTVNDIQDNGLNVIVKLRDTKNGETRSFAITDEFYEIYKKYRAKRPAKTESPRFFINYRAGVCTNQVIGINKFGAMAKRIAEFLKLPNPELYTGHSFRRTSATLLAESGADLMKLQRHGGWKSGKIAQGYVDENENSKKQVAKQIMHMIIPETPLPLSASNKFSSTTSFPPSTSLPPATEVTPSTSTGFSKQRVTRIIPETQTSSSSPPRSLQIPGVSLPKSNKFNSTTNSPDSPEKISDMGKRRKITENINLVKESSEKSPPTTVKVTIDNKENIAIGNVMADMLPGGTYTFSFTNCPNLTINFLKNSIRICHPL